LIVHLVLTSLPAHFGHFKVSYNTQKDKWPLHELISHCVQEEERLKREKTESAHLTTSSQKEKEKDCWKYFSKREGGTTTGVHMFHLQENRTHERLF
jgi:hypothetical protein